jgi:hypothetical protein
MDIVFPGRSPPALTLHASVQWSEPQLNPFKDQRQQLRQSLPLDVLKEHHVAKLYIFGVIFNSNMIFWRKFRVYQKKGPPS